MKENPIDTKLQLKALQKKPLPHHASIALPVGTALSTGLFLVAVPELTGADTFIDYIKCGLLAGATGFTAYTVNRFALEKGTFQAAIGSLPAGLISNSSMIAIGAALTMCTYTGFVKDETDRLRLQEFATDKAAWVQAHANSAQDASRAIPVFSVVVEDLEQKAACETEDSCVSGIGNGGFGPVARKLSGAHGRAQAVASEIAAASQSQSSALAQLHDLQDGIQSLLNDPSLSAAERRTGMEDLSRDAGGLLGQVQQTSPATLIASFAEQLLQEQGSAPEDRLLASHGRQLLGALKEDGVALAPPPAFPQPTGVWDAFCHIGHFLPIGLAVLVADLALPLSIWWFAFIGLRVRLQEIERETAKAPRRRNPSRTRKTGGSDEQA